MAAIKDIMNPNPTLNLFYQVYQPWWRSYLWRIVGRRPRRLLDLSTLACNWTIRSRRFAGRQMVSIDQIQGSESRASDFDATFRPRAYHMAERWCQVAEAWLEGGALPPIELIRVGEGYFVRDGHHRISVAATFDAREVDALVTVWEVDGRLPWEQPTVATATQSSLDVCSADQPAVVPSVVGSH